jgi:hypothetical protein
MGQYSQVAANVYVVPRDNGWAVRRYRERDDVATHPLEIQALATAIGIAEREGAALIVYGRDGNVTYDSRQTSAFRARITRG